MLNDSLPFQQLRDSVRAGSFGDVDELLARETLIGAIYQVKPEARRHHSQERQHQKELEKSH